MLIVLVERRDEDRVRSVVRRGETHPAIRVGDSSLPVRFTNGAATIHATSARYRVTAGTTKVFWEEGARVSAWIE